MSGEERTQHWLRTMGGQNASDEQLGYEDRDEIISPHDEPFSYGHGDLTTMEAPESFPDEGISSPVDSVDLDRNSVYSIGDEDAGPPSIETQPPDNSDDLEVSGITTTWINSGGHFATTEAAQFSSSVLETDIGMASEKSVTIDTEVPAGPVYGPFLPSDSFNSPSREASLQYGDIADDSTQSGICGLRNLGNTCFMAAGIQCLVNTPPIAQYFFNHNYEEKVAGNIVSCFSQLIHKIWSGKYSALHPSDFKYAFGQHWRDFRDYRQHDCQEFVTLLLEALRKQMPLLESEGFCREPLCIKPSTSAKQANRPSCSSNSSVSTIGSRCASSSPTPPQSPHCPPSPVSPECLKNDLPEDPVGLDSGPASPKSSVSSSSVDAHLINLRLQPIPEEVKSSNRMDVSTDDLSISGTISCQDAESVHSDMSDSGDGVNVVSGSGLGLQGAGGVMAVRQYNQLASTSSDICDTFGCDTSSADLPERSGGSNEESLDSSSAAHSDYLCSTDCDSSQFNSSNYLNETDKVRGQLNVTSTLPGEKNRSKVQLDKITSSNNKGHLSVVKLEDILKESKTSNVNVLGKDSVSNNKLFFDSEKYAKAECKKLTNSVDNLSRAGIKRVKEVNLLVDKMDNSVLDSSEARNSKSNSSLGINSNLALRKRMRLEEKNVQYERSQSEGISCDAASSSSIPEIRSHHSTSAISSHEHKLAEQGWKSFIDGSKSAVVDTFYGQFRSSLVCSVCGHTSIKFDPFGTLSVPLPHANEIQIPTIFVPVGDNPPMRCLITLCKVSYIKELKTALAQLVHVDEEKLVIAEVFDNHIARIVDDSYVAKYLNCSTRSIYAFQLAAPPPSSDDMSHVDVLSCDEKFNIETSPKIEGDALNVGEDNVEACKIGVYPKEDNNNAACSNQAGNTVTESDAQWQKCKICLEELCQTDLKTHENCEDCLLCDGCIEMSRKHHGGGSAPCPVCHTRLMPADLIPVDKRKAQKPKARILRVSVVFRVDTESDDNNKRDIQLIGHPRLLHLPSRMRSDIIHKMIERKLLPHTKFTLLLVDGRGYNCSRCLFSSHCRGCDVIRGPEVTLQAGDTLCVRFTQISNEQTEALKAIEEHPTLMAMRQNAPLTVYDCLRAFTQSETLEESESWFCPKCEKKQQATKTISVWKCPPYLIIHLERFLFHGTLSTKVDDKVIFPLDGLDLTDFVAGDHQSPLIYNLYGCVCHMGVAQAGHYTAVVRSPVTREWHYFNDDSVSKQKPREEEYSTAYLLFYHRQGTNFDLRLPCIFNIPKLSEKLDPSTEEAVIGSTTDHDMVDPFSQDSRVPSSPVSTNDPPKFSQMERRFDECWDAGESRIDPAVSNSTAENTSVTSSDVTYTGDEAFEQKMMGADTSYHVASFMQVD